MSVPTPDLVLLGLLMDSELHGYELRRLVEEQMSHVARIPPGTIYYTLKKLEKRGLVTHSVEREGNRPERQVYEITDHGRAAFQQLLAEAVYSDERPYYLFDAALYFYPHVDKEQLLSAVQDKLEHVDAFNRQLDELAQKYPGRWPFHLEALRKKGELLSAATEDWYRYLEQGLQKRLGKKSGPPTRKKKRKSRKKTGARPSGSRSSGSSRRKETRS